MGEQPVHPHRQKSQADAKDRKAAYQNENSEDHHHPRKVVEQASGSIGGTVELNERVAKLEIRLDNAEDDMREWRAEIRQAANEVRDLKEQIRTLGFEQRSAIGQVATNASKPFEQLHWGWRVLAGLGTFAIGAVSILGGIAGITAFLRNH